MMWVPEQVATVMRFGTLAQRKKLGFLPQLQSTEKSWSQLTLRMTSYPLSLRELLNDQARLIAHGNQVVSSLITAYLAAEEQGLVMRSIQPATVYFDRTLDHAMFVDLRSTCQVGDDVDFQGESHAPYCSERFFSRDWLKNSETERDMWSIGVLLLEILLGTKLVLAHEGFLNIKDLLETFEKCFDPQTLGILKWYLFIEAGVNSKTYLEQTLGSKPDLIGNNIKRVNYIATDDFTIQDYKDWAESKFEENRAKWQEKYQL